MALPFLSKNFLRSCRSWTDCHLHKADFDSNDLAEKKKKMLEADLDCSSRILQSDRQALLSY